MDKKILMALILVYVLQNIAVFAAYGIDKLKARSGSYRIPEAKLLGGAFLGGGVGAFLGMQLFRHKTKHMRFVILVPLFMIVQVILWILLACFWL